MVHSHTVLTAVIAVGAATSALAAPLRPLSEAREIKITPSSNAAQFKSDPKLPGHPGKSLNAREFDIIVEEDSHKHHHHHPHPHHHHEEFEVEVEGHHSHNHGEGFEVEFEGEHHYSHHPHHHHHHGGEDFEVDVEFDEHHPHHPHPHHHHGEDFEVDVELEEHRPHRHHGEENFEIEVEEHQHHQHHHHHHGGEHFEHKHHGHHAHHHEVEVVPIPIPVPVEHKDFKHPMGRPSKVVKDEVWVVATEGNPVGIDRRQDEGGLPPPAPVSGSGPSSSIPPASSGPPPPGGRLQQMKAKWQTFQQSPKGQQFSSKLHEGVTKHFPLNAANASPSDSSQLRRRNPSTLPTGAAGSTGDEIPSSPTLPMSPPPNGAPGKHHLKQSKEWKAIKTANKDWRSDMNKSSGDWEKFLETETGKAVKAKEDPELVVLVKHALKQHTNPNNPKSHQSPSEGATSTGAAGASTTAPGSGASSLSSSSSSALKRRSGTNPSGSSTSVSSASSTDGDSPMGSSTSSTDAAGLGATGSAAASSMGTGSLPSGTSSAFGSTSGSAASASPSGAATTTSAGYSSAHHRMKGQHREEWKKFKEANPSVNEDLKSAKGNVQAFLQTPSGKALAKENEDFQKFVKIHVVEHHKKHGQDHHHKSAGSEHPAPLDGSSSSSSSSSSPASGTNAANPAPVGRSVLAARYGFGAHGSKDTTDENNHRAAGHRHHIRSVPGEAGDAPPPGTPGQTSALPIQSSSSTPNGPGMGAVNGAPSFSGTLSSGAISGSSMSGFPPSAPPNGNGQGPEGSGPHGHRFEDGPMGPEHHGSSMSGFPPSAPPNGNGQGGLPQSHQHGGFQSFDQSGVPRPSIDVLQRLGAPRLEHLTPPGTNLFGSSPRPPPHDNTGSVPGTPPNPASGASSPPPSGATSQGMPGAPTRRALQRVRRSTPYGDFGADLD
ncbi:uncharacterized protein C8R40DRAFT_653179 [Lentinula edodes]|uniref:uncharacterized protein n=1 Tax=Lentinula edodes TaxID=5353 RepID=UPI001E8EDC0A|nr:uncharacterized protein C8R40DRAFT_653179 [Lentinula edodes]KAH7870332.1 hypothetical protein C8R40DRAFT_653179 [Lentinula edodes]